MNCLRGLYIDGAPIRANDWKLQLKSRTHQTDVLFSFRFNYYFSGFFLSFSIFGFWEIENIMAPICFLETSTQIENVPSSTKPVASELFQKEDVENDHFPTRKVAGKKSDA